MHPSQSPERWPQIEKLLDEALELPAERRAEFLERVSAGDAELRCAVQDLLDACETGEGFLPRPSDSFVETLLQNRLSRGRLNSPFEIGDRVGPYRILAEAGRGGMAVVYRADRDDGSFRKRVALKVVHAADVPGGEAHGLFDAERQILADLEHPGIARLLDGGVTEAGLPWFAMEYVKGTPIDRYCDERGLSVEQRLALFCSACDAVQHAHRRRIVHRDLKPGNVLVAEPDGEEPDGEEAPAGQVKLLDFGIATLLASGDAEDGDERARQGLRLLTPEYASPEQLRGDAITPATDVYSLGLLLRRLLGASGRDGFDAAEPPRGRLPDGLHAIVRRATHEQPGERFADAGEFAAELRRYLRGERRQAVRPSRRRHLVVTSGVTTLVGVFILTAWFPGDRSAEPPIDPEAVVVTPFHVAAEGSLEYLREGLVDLLANSLNGETGSRAVDPRASLAAWRAVIGDEYDVSPSAAQAIARRLGAGRVLMGSLVGHPARLTLNATLFDAVRETVLVRVSVRGSEEELQSLVEAVAAQLLAEGAGIPRHQLAAAGTTPLPALRSYLAGRQSFRLGRFSEAVRHLEEALAYDSTFALAATHLWLATGDGPLTAAPGTRDRALRLAWTGRDRLSGADRLLLEAIAGPRYPEPTPRHERLAAYTRAVNAAPDRPEVLWLMGGIHHAGVLRGEPDAQQRSDAYFRRALALDSSFAWPAYQVVREAAGGGDAATVRRVVRRYLVADSTSEMAHLLTWMEAAVGGEERAIREVRARMPTMHPTALGWIVFHALLLGRDMDGAEAALAALRAGARSEHELGNYRFREWEYLGNRGRLREMWSSMDVSAREAQNSGPVPELGMSAAAFAQGQRDVYLIRTALFWGGDTTGIGGALTRMEYAYGQTPARDGAPIARVVVADGACFAGIGRITERDLARAQAAAARLHQLLDSDRAPPNRHPYVLCATTIEALVAVAARRPDARDQLERVDSMLRHDPPGRMVMSRTQLLLARAWAEVGDPETGLRILRRRQATNPAYFLATILAEEGRLATLVGDREGAVRAYRHYLVLRTHPDPVLVPEVQRIREELARLASNP